jgi:hypothetical protein
MQNIFNKNNLWIVVCFFHIKVDVSDMQWYRQIELQECFNLLHLYNAF